MTSEDLVAAFAARGGGLTFTLDGKCYSDVGRSMTDQDWRRAVIEALKRQNRSARAQQREALLALIRQQPMALAVLTGALVGLAATVGPIGRRIARYL